MTEHYVTLFDSAFLPERTRAPCFARTPREATTRSGWCAWTRPHSRPSRRSPFPTCNPLRLADLETPELLAVKATRTFGEYCWTLTPFTPDVVFDRAPEAGRATYIDADMWLAAVPRRSSTSSRLPGPQRSSPTTPTHLSSSTCADTGRTACSSCRSCAIPATRSAPGGSSDVSSGASPARRTASSVTRSTSTTGRAASDHWSTCSARPS